MIKAYRMFRKITWQVLIFTPNIIADLVLLILLPFLISYGWARYFYKRTFNLPYKVLFSPISIPMSFLSAQAVQTQGVAADVLSYDLEPVFQEMKIGFCLKEHPWLFYLTLLTDYIPFFIWGMLKYDLFEFPVSGGLLYASKLRRLELLLLKICAKKIIVYCYGADAYLPSEILKLGKINALMDAPHGEFNQQEGFIRGNIRRVRKYADSIISGADMIWLGPKALYLPIAFDLKKWPQATLKQKKTLTLIHSTNHRIYKGTRFLIKAYEELKKEGYPIKLRLIEGRPIEECYKLYPQGDIFITDLIIGWYGSTQIEAMSIGRPVVSYGNKKIAPFHRYYAKDCPLVNGSPLNLKRVLKNLIKDPKLRRELGRQGAAFARKYHSFEFVGKLRTVIYDEVWEGRKISQKKFEKILRQEKVI